MPQIFYTQRAVKDLEKINPPDLKRIKKSLEALSFGLISPIPLVGPLKGLYKLRVGSYRAIFEIPKASSYLIRYVRHRKDVYDF